jgi:transglutaminase-like putative cysteine protease
MRRLRIEHLTTYQFGTMVQLLPHKLLLRPREGHDIRIESSKLNITPFGQLKWHRDIYGNSVASAEFHLMAATLQIASEVVIQNFDDAPMDFRISPLAENYPFQYAASELANLLPYQTPCYAADAPAVAKWVDQFRLAGRTIGTFDLLFSMNKAIANGLVYQAREMPGVQSPDETLRKGSGSCRDFATLFIEACRSLGFAAHFVSGYLHCPGTQTGGGSTHAWSEVYLPGAGWKGFDSTSGLMTGADHIAVAVSRHPADVPPVSGSFTGPGGLLPSLSVGVKVSLI